MPENLIPRAEATIRTQLRQVRTLAKSASTDAGAEVAVAIEQTLRWARGEKVPTPSEILRKRGSPALAGEI